MFYCLKCTCSCDNALINNSILSNSLVKAGLLVCLYYKGISVTAKLPFA